nr:Signal peptidase I [Pandoravirus aubagnensis]
MKHTQTHHHRDNTKAHRRASASGTSALSVGATIFWAIYPILWTCLVCFAISRFLGCTVPVAAVTSGSMEPQTYRGDLLLLVGPDFGGPVRVGDIVLYRLPHRPETPIVHRVVDIVNGSAYPSGQADGDARWYLTKGDDNEVDDVGLVVPSFPSGLLPHAALIGTNACFVPSPKALLVVSVGFSLCFFLLVYVLTVRALFVQ